MTSEDKQHFTRIFPTTLNKYHDLYHSFILCIEFYLKIVTGGLLTSSTIIIIYHVIARFLHFPSLIWAYEFGKFSMFWIAFLFFPILVLNDRHLSIGLVFNRLSDNYQIVLKLIQSFGAILLGFVLFYYGLKYSLTSGAYSTSAALHIQMTYVYIVFPISGILLMLCSLDEFVMAIRNPDRIGEEFDIRISQEDST